MTIEQDEYGTAEDELVSVPPIIAWATTALILLIAAVSASTLFVCLVGF